MEILEKVEQLKAELDALRPLDADLEALVWQKFRLDWNYHSNKLEGNTYSFGETKMLLLKDRTAGGKPKRDSDEILGHDEAISFILESIKEKEELTEVFIRHLHKMILVKPFWADAKTGDGQPTKRLIKVGEYKTEPNHVETQSGAIFRFAEPIETPAKMQELVEWFRGKVDMADTNVILLAAEFHYRFVRIHPFDDGNGRLARLLMNFVLMKYGLPPVIIKNEDKDNYIAVLEQADFQILEPFVEYVAQNLVRSVEIMIKGAKGEEIEEPDDIDKEIAVLERRIRGFGKKIDVKRSEGIVREILEKSVYPLMQRYFTEFHVFDKFYVESHLKVLINGRVNQEEFENASRFAGMNFEGESQINEVRLVYLGNSLNQDAFGTFQYESTITVTFELTKYRAMVSGNQWGFDKLYSEQLSEEEIEKLINAEKKFHLDLIKKKVGDLEEKRS
jgi:Fic family protein